MIGINLKENLKRVSIKDVVLNKRNIFTGKYQLKSQKVRKRGLKN